MPAAPRIAETIMTAVSVSTVPTSAVSAVDLPEGCCLEQGGTPSDLQGER